jgi:TolB-like protein/Tfp pilus assembly protein PilF
MKRCPQCGREYDTTMMFCLDDGAELLYGPKSGSGDDRATAILSGADGVPPSVDVTDDNATQILTRTTAGVESEPRSSSSRSSERPSLSASRAARPLVGVVIAAAVLLGGFFGYRYLNSTNAEQVNSIAVLPFENRSGSGDTEYLSDGLADSLIYRLSQLPNLKVSPTSSVMRYKGKETDVSQIARDLEVDAVMAGRLVQRADDLSISVQLTDARTGKVIWAEQYERKMSDLLATQREIATTITQKLELKLGDGDSRGITKKYTDNNEAYQAYLKGRYYWNRRTAENLKKAIEQFKSATDKDPNFALAYSGLADCYSLLPEYAGIPVDESVQKAKAFAERAIKIDDQLAEGHASLGQVYKASWQWAEAEREYRRAIEVNPNYATSYHWYAHLLRNLGRYDEAAETIMRGHQVDPLSSVISVNVAEIYRFQGKHQAAIDTSLKVIEIDPNFAYAYVNLGLAYLSLGRNSEAIANLEKGAELSNRAGFALSNLGYGYGAVGKRAEASVVIRELEERYARKESAAVFVAGVYAGIGDKDKAFEWLEKGFQNKDDFGFFRWRVHFESLRDDPRFADLLKRMGLA